MKTALAVILFAALALAQPVRYAPLPPGGSSPDGRIDGTIVYDPAGRQLFIFGGDTIEIGRASCRERV